jgi:hypothetical protein
MDRQGKVLAAAERYRVAVATHLKAAEDLRRARAAMDSAVSVKAEALKEREAAENDLVEAALSSQDVAVDA